MQNDRVGSSPAIEHHRRERWRDLGTAVLLIIISAAVFWAFPAAR